MSKNGDGESDHNVTMDEGSSNDGYSDDGINYRQYSDTMLYNVPDEMRPYVRRLVKDSGNKNYKYILIINLTFNICF